MKRCNNDISFVYKFCHVGCVIRSSAQSAQECETRVASLCDALMKGIEQDLFDCVEFNLSW